jgi:hypothetical protein
MEVIKQSYHLLCNLYAVKPVTLRPAAVLHSCCTSIVTFAIFRIVHTHTSQVDILLYLHLLVIYVLQV